MKKAKKKDMETMGEQLSSLEMRAVVKEEFAPLMRRIEETPAQELEAKQKYIDELPKYMSELVARIRAIRASSPEAKQIRAKEEQEIVAEISRHLGYKDELLRSKAINSYADAILTTLPAEPQMADVERVLFGENDLPGLFKLGLISEGDLKKTELPSVRFEGRKFQLPGGQGSRRAYLLRMAIEKATKTEVTRWQARGKLTKEELLAGKQGLVFIKVPDRVVGDKKKTLHGGALLVVSGNGIVKVVEYAGGFEAIMAKIVEADIFVPLRQLFFSNPDEPKLSAEKLVLFRTFHSILRRGLESEISALHATRKKAKATSTTGVTNAKTEDVAQPLAAG